MRIEFKGKISEEDLLRVDGVINASISDHDCEVIVDEGERRLGPLAALFSEKGVLIKPVTLDQTDLEDVFFEFSKDAGSDRGICI